MRRFSRAIAPDLPFHQRQEVLYQMKHVLPLYLPSFNPDEFLKQCNSMLQDATHWMLTKQLEKLRPITSESVQQQIKTFVDGYEAQGLKLDTFSTPGLSIEASYVTEFQVQGDLNRLGLLRNPICHEYWLPYSSPTDSITTAQADVRFNTTESFQLIETASNQVIAMDLLPTQQVHHWTFETCLSHHRLFQWRVIDMNQRKYRRTERGMQLQAWDRIKAENQTAITRQIEDSPLK